MIHRLVTGLGARVDEHADLRVELASDSVEQPSMRVDLLRVLLLEDENDLNRHLLSSVAKSSNVSQIRKLP